ncbi:hypothetical protein NBRC116601_14440 [Cognatishimia sp. WU-CL00825]|uniref:DUF1127 domain-containing protein n=1 Tax=Cognatishimia sp. WU-CL00825 TaxID=3127658 RepID=UPI0031029CD0
MAAIENTYAPSAFAGRFGKTFVSIVSRFFAWNETRKTRAVLAQLTDRELADIGLSRSAIIEIQ